MPTDAEEYSSVYRDFWLVVCFFFVDVLFGLHFCETASSDQIPKYKPLRNDVGTPYN